MSSKEKLQQALSLLREVEGNNLDENKETIYGRLTEAIHGVEIVIYYDGDDLE